MVSGCVPYCVGAIGYVTCNRLSHNAGLGVAYSPLKDRFLFNVTSLVGVGGVQFCKVLEMVLTEMKDTMVLAKAPARARL